MVDLGPADELLLGEHEMKVVEGMCLCPGCPAYPEEDRGTKRAYCLRGDSDHKASIEPKDCHCEMCPVYKHGKLYGSNYFCMMGAALAKGFRNVATGKPISELAHEREDPRPTLFVSGAGDVHRKNEGGVTRERAT